MNSYESYTIEREGMTFSVGYYYDEGMRAPWQEHDGHGVVSEWTTRAKRAGERVLASDRGSARFYDVAESIKVALRDGWGDGEDKAGRTKRQIAASAVDKDFEHLKAWCNDEWHWAGVVVTLLDVAGDETKESESLWGTESEGEHLKEIAVELADEIAARVPADGVLAVQVRHA